MKIHTLILLLIASIATVHACRCFTWDDAFDDVTTERCCHQAKGFYHCGDCPAELIADKMWEFGRCCYVGQECSDCKTGCYDKVKQLAKDREDRKEKSKKGAEEKKKKEEEEKKKKEEEKKKKEEEKSKKEEDKKKKEEEKKKKEEEKKKKEEDKKKKEEDKKRKEEEEKKKKEEEKKKQEEEKKKKEEEEKKEKDENKRRGLHKEHIHE